MTKHYRAAAGIGTMCTRLSLPAAITAVADRVEIELDEPASGVAAGQAAVLYVDSRVIGSATIASARA